MALSQQQIDAIENPGYSNPFASSTKKASVGSAKKTVSQPVSQPVVQKTASVGSAQKASGGATAPIVQQIPTETQKALDIAATQTPTLPTELTSAQQDALDKQAAVQVSPVTGIGNQKSAQELATEQAIAYKQAAGAQNVPQYAQTGKITTEVPESVKTPSTGIQTESGKMFDQAIQNVNSQIQQISNTTFDYNPLSDSQYLRDAANLENQITQMMVGRGGMYSSVAQNALSSQMINLQNNYIQNKYTEFKDNRNFQLQLAQQNFENAMSVASAKNTQEQQALDQAWKELQFKIDQEDKAFQRQQQINEYNLKVSQLNYEIQSAKAQAEAQQNIANVQAQYALYADAKSNLEKQYAAWQQKGTSDASIVQAFAALGITIPVGANISYYSTQVTNAFLNLANMETLLKENAVEANDTIEILDLLDALNNPTVTKEITEYTYDSEGRRVSSTTGKVEVPVSEAFGSSKKSQIGGKSGIATGAQAVK